MFDQYAEQEQIGTPQLSWPRSQIAIHSQWELTVAVTNMVVQVNRRVDPCALFILALCMENMTVLDPGILRGRRERHFYRVFRSAGGMVGGLREPRTTNEDALYTAVNDPLTWISKPLHHLPHPEFPGARSEVEEAKIEVCQI